MPDDPNKRGPQDRRRTSTQKHEQAYRRKTSGGRGNRSSTSSRSPGQGRSGKSAG